MITLQPHQFKFNKSEKMFYVDANSTRFATSYKLVNPKTGGLMIFDFYESTGPEWLEDTKFLYTSDEGFCLELSNEPRRILNKRATAYVEAKTTF